MFKKERKERKEKDKKSKKLVSLGPVRPFIRTCHILVMTLLVITRLCDYHCLLLWAHGRLDTWLVARLLDSGLVAWVCRWRRSTFMIHCLHLD